MEVDGKNTASMESTPMVQEAIQEQMQNTAGDRQAEHGRQGHTAHTALAQ